MSLIARLEVIPGRAENMTEAVADAVEALEEFDVSYETTPTDTVIEADDPSEVFAATEAAHRAVGDDRVITSLEIDEHRARAQRRRDRVESVERVLGRPAKRERDAGRDDTQQAEAQRYRSPVQSAVERRATGRQSESTESTSRYLRPQRPVSR